MAVFYKIEQIKNEASSANGKYYLRQASLGTMSLDDVAQYMEDNATAKKSDVLAVLTEALYVMKIFLKQSYKVSLGDLGTFTTRIKNGGSFDDPGDAAEAAQRAHLVVGFEPKYELVTGGDGKRTRVYKALGSDATLRQMPSYSSPADAGE